MAITKVTRTLLSTGIDDQSNATAITIDSSENVGIGTTDADSKLKVELKPSGTVLAGLRVGYNGTSVNYLDGDTNIFRNGLGNTERMRIDSSGNVGIGTSSFNATYDPRLQVTSAASDGTGGILIQNYLPTLTLEDISGGAAVSQIQQDQTNMLFKNNGTERMRISSTGDLTITSNTTGLAGNFENTNTSGYGLRVTTYATGVEYGLAVDSYGGGYSRDFTVGVDGNVNVLTGNLVIGTAGKGIDFSATSGAGTSELLDDYEEGTWTPIDVTMDTWTSPTFTATYTKIGRLVTVELRQTGGTIGWSAGDAISGLPFSPAKGSIGYASDTGPTSDNGPVLAWTNSYVYFQSANASETALMFSITYEV
jgi:hypothetical protein